MKIGFRKGSQFHQEDAEAVNEELMGLYQINNRLTAEDVL